MSAAGFTQHLSKLKGLHLLMSTSLRLVSGISDGREGDYFHRLGSLGLVVMHACNAMKVR